MGKSKVKFTPAGTGVLIQKAEAVKEKIRESGIVIPENAGVNDSPARGVVVAVGPGIFNSDGTSRKPLFAPGDDVLFVRYAGTEIEIEGALYTLLAESDLFGKFN